MLTERYPRALTYSAGIHVWHHSVGEGSMADLLSASALVLQATGDEDLAIAALVHDAVDACGGTGRIADLRARFGDRVAATVAGCSLPDDEAWQASRTQRERLGARLDMLSTADSDSLLILVAVATVEARALAAAGPAQRVNDDLRADYLAASRLIARERPLPTVLAAAFDQAVDGLHTTV